MFKAINSYHKSSLQIIKPILLPSKQSFKSLANFFFFLIFNKFLQILLTKNSGISTMNQGGSLKLYNFEINAY